MFQTADNWKLFGLDLRLIGGLWRTSWREFMWGNSSPVIAHLDETVRVHSGDSVQYFYAGKPKHQSNPDTVACEAILLPSDSVLSKTLYLPLAVEADLDAAMSLEIGAHNPFPAGDTVSGWTILGKTGESLHIGLAIASASAVMSFLSRDYNCHDSRAFEVWAQVEEEMVILEGFGESGRRLRYRQRCLKVAGLMLVSALLVIAIFGSFAVIKNIELHRYEEMSETIQREAFGASQARQSLLKASETIVAVNKYVAMHPNAHVEIARLTNLLGDDASIISLGMTGTEIQLRGRARDAAAVVQELTEESAYEKVSSPQAITKLGNTGFEEFHLDITLARGDSL